MLRPGDVYCLAGPLGAGKTAFARAAIDAALRAEGRPEDIPSPTFTLVQTYEAACPIWHADLYRLTDPEEALELGLDEAFETAAVFIEWPERLGPFLPGRRAELIFSYAEGGAARAVEIRFRGPGWDHARRALEGAP